MVYVFWVFFLLGGFSGVYFLCLLLFRGRFAPVIKHKPLEVPMLVWFLGLTLEPGWTPHEVV